MKNLNEQISRMKSMMGLNESVTYNYVNKGVDKYEFVTDKGIIYEVHLYPKKGYSFKTYEASFNVKGKNSEYETKLDMSHLNSVLNTVCSIVEKEIKDKGIRKVIMNPAYGERDVNKSDNRKLFNPNTRYELYLRFLRNRYPEDAILPGLGTIGIDATKIFPNIFNEPTKLSIIMDLLNGFNNVGKKIEVADFDGEDESNFKYEGELENDNRGMVYVVISVQDGWGEYNIEIEDIDGDGGKNEEYFNSFEKLIEYIKINLI